MERQRSFEGYTLTKGLIYLPLVSQCHLLVEPSTLIHSLEFIVVETMCQWTSTGL